MVDNPMRRDLFETMCKKYQAGIADAKMKIQLLQELPYVIPEHIDVTGEIDKLLGIIEENESRLSILRRDYGTN